MALVSLSSECFNSLDRALKALNAGDISSSQAALHVIKRGGSKLQREAAALCAKLKIAEEESQRQNESLTIQINELFEAEKQLEKEKRELETKRSSLENEKKQSRKKYDKASNRYHQARREKEEAERKNDELKSWWWVPVYGQVLAVRELIEGNLEKEQDASREMDNCQSDIRRAERETEWASSAISEAEENIRKISKEKEDLEKERGACRERLGDIKSTTSFLMQAVTFWDEVIVLTKSATVKTGNLQRILDLAAKQNSVKILRSNGTKTMANSFKDCWMEVAGMICDENSLTPSQKTQTKSLPKFVPGELCVSSIKTAIGTSHTEELDSLAAAFADVLSSLNHHIAIKPFTPETVAENCFAPGKEEKETPGRPRLDIPAEMLA
ncbi:tropomyosin alpha-1 chain-like [Montipora capricornis]|uniref:tropomyosin alpha-1 chain-like n=1 Tax=Montipora capricornis TaxID=246305 RepID=UPI0035F20920